MKNKITTLFFTLLLALWAPLLFAKGGHHPEGGHPHGDHHSQKMDKPDAFPGKGESTEHSNAPSTGTQMKGQERAMEVGKGKKKGLHKEEQAPQTLPR